MKKHFLSLLCILSLVVATVGPFFSVAQAQQARTPEEIRQQQIEAEQQAAQQKADEEAAKQKAEEEAKQKAAVDARQKAADDLKNKISQNGIEIQKLEQEIAQYNSQIAQAQAKSQTLSSTIKKLDLTKQKLLTDISLTGNKIDATNYSIAQIQLNINSTTEKMQMNSAAIAELMRNLDELESKNIVEVVLSANAFSEVWNDIEGVQQFRGVISNKLSELKTLEDNLQSSKSENEKQVASLQDLKTQLGDQKKVVEVTKTEKSSLLTETKNQESEYQKKLKEKKAAKEAFEKALADYESQLKFVLDQSSLPSLGSGVLGWPLKDVSLGSCYDASGSAHANCITQYFGNTAFAATGAYNGQGHNGIDFNATVGSQVYASAAGTVKATGNTDQYPGCYSYGKWVLITHANGLSTLYAHLSLIKVESGQIVAKGDLIGYSGNTGYTTGPHLHFGVFATEGVNVVRLGSVKKVTGCANASIPVAAYNAYLNPLNYLTK